MFAGEEWINKAQNVLAVSRPLYADSIFVKYKIDNGAYHTLIMTSTGSDN